HEGHTHEGHTHEGHTHEGHTHEGHTHEGHGHGRQRGYREIVELIDASTLAESVRERARAMFLNLAKAEARVHDMPIEEVHFHEVGAVDSIIDIVGTAICIDILGVDAVYSTPLRTGSGTVIRTQHGMMPVPAPATMELLKGYPVELTALPYELTTPTGATIIATLSSGVLARDCVLRVDAIGYGAGTKEFPELPNMLRLVVGEIDTPSTDEALLLLETNIDDMNPELYPYVLERLLETGARDAWLTPVLMKKGRPAHVLTVLGDEAHRDILLSLLWNETSTTGVRIQTVTRRILPRSVEQVQTRFGAVTVKGIQRDGTQLCVPEFEECRRIARERNLPLIEVYHMIEYDIMLKRGEQSQPGKGTPEL
ncbi:MAG: nickel pincer cofactor biosynthesis protein LarC, partial [Bacteroidetes bacterium]|nr:nickel pincer cofactor biosynthesis protein LarC [Bacteroidota bacterium]